MEEAVQPSGQEKSEKEQESKEQKEVKAKKDKKAEIAKENFLKTGKKKPADLKKKGLEFRGVPLYLWGLFLLLGVVGGVALHVFLTPPAPPIVVEPPGIFTGEAKPVEVQLIYSKDCDFCLKHNTILDTFNENEIEFSVTEFEASTEEGKQKTQKFNINIFTTALVPIEQMLWYPEIKEAMDKSFTKTSGFYVVPESNLDSSKLYSTMYLKPVYPADCNTSIKPKVILFDDPYNELSIRTSPILINILKDFGEFIDLEFEYIPANTSTLSPDTNSLAKDLAAEYLVCASLQDTLRSSMKDRFLDVYIEILQNYCSIADLPNELERILFCNLSVHFGTPLTLEELESTLADFDEEEKIRFASCLTIAKQRNLDSLLRATKLGIHRTGTAIVDCKYNVPISSIDDAVCATYPDIEPCNTNE